MTNPEHLPVVRCRCYRSPVAAVRASGEDAGLFDLLGEEPA